MSALGRYVRFLMIKYTGKYFKLKRNNPPIWSKSGFEESHQKFHFHILKHSCTLPWRFPNDTLNIEMISYVTYYLKLCELQQKNKSEIFDVVSWNIIGVLWIRVFFNFEYWKGLRGIISYPNRKRQLEGNLNSNISLEWSLII